MSDLFGHTRTVVRERYALITPDGFVSSKLPGWDNVVAIVNISPVLGARFTQVLLTLNDKSRGEGHTGVLEKFIHVLAGGVSAKLGAKKTTLAAGGYVFIPPQMSFSFSGAEPGTQLLIFEKKFEPLTGAKKVGLLIGHEKEMPGNPFLGNEDARLQVLLPDQPEFDLAVNIFTYQPGATLPFVETHIMEHGLLMLSGQGVYRLGDEYYPVRAGDVIWMASYCPQWFVAMGKTPASYIYYKDVNRSPL